MKHENIMPVLHVGEDQGVLFIAMPLLPGESLAARLKREGRLPVALVVQVGRETAAALAAAHAKGLIHRDIKPGNIWLENHDSGVRVQVLDFGLGGMKKRLVN